MGHLAFVIMERILVAGEELTSLPKSLKWWKCPNPNCGKYVIKDLGMDGQIKCVAPSKGGCGKESQKVSKKESHEAGAKVITKKFNIIQLQLMRNDVMDVSSQVRHKS